VQVLFQIKVHLFFGGIYSADNKELLAIIRMLELGVFLLAATAKQIAS
jgi:hypothetical protein